MQQAKRGDKVRVHYTGTLDDGTEFDSSVGGDPLEFTIGAGEVIRGFEDAVIGMKAGEEKRETIPAANAYGQRKDELVFKVDRKQIPDDMDISIGDALHVGFPDGGAAEVQVVAMDDASLTLDANHPLADKDLTFEMKLVGIGA